jgi:hypothetical protein
MAVRLKIRAFRDIAPTRREGSNLQSAVIIAFKPLLSYFLLFDDLNTPPLPWAMG